MIAKGRNYKEEGNHDISARGSRHRRPSRSMPIALKFVDPTQIVARVKREAR